MHIPIRTGVQNRCINCRRKSHILQKKMLFLKLIFQDEGHLYAYCLLYIPTIYRKFFSFKFLGGGIHIHIFFLTKV